jgi:Xaa-Pro aminopeptidase
VTPTAAELERRLGRVREALQSQELEGAVIWGRSFYDRPGPIAYLTGYVPPFPSSADAPGIVGLGQAALVVPTRGQPSLYIDTIASNPSGAVLDVVESVVRSADMAAEVGRHLRSLGAEGARLGLGGEDIVPHRIVRLLTEAVPGLAFVPFDPTLMDLRRVKSEAEVEGMRRACQVARKGFEAAVATLGVGRSEREVSAAGVAACLAAGADFIRYFRVHAGKASAGGSRWPPATDARIADGDLVTMDLIGAVDGFGFDLLRTAVVGRASADARTLAADAYAVHKAGRAALRPGGTVADLAALVQAAAKETASGPYLRGFYGHGIGLETLEWPYLIPGQDATFAAGEVLCLEPGLYRTGFGGACLEDEIIVRAGEPELISDFLQEPIVID